MATMTVPTDPRPQFTMVDLALAHAFGGGPSLDQFQQIGPDRYILANSWPTPTPTNKGGGGFSPAVSAEAQPQPEPSRSAAGALALWPNLK
jgi:hypothetical protein